MFERTLQIIDKDLFKEIQNQKILLVGVGGVGSSALEALVRSGFLNITIIDHDTIEESNLNRQIITNQNNIGKLKVDEAQKRYLEINPNINLKTLSFFLNKDNIDKILDEEYDFIIDACDTITTKYLLIKKAHEKNIDVISCMGTGNKFDPSKLSITTLDKTYNDPLAKAMRSLLKKDKKLLKVSVIWSSEVPVKTNNTIGSMIMVPNTAGMLSVTYIIQKLKTAF